MDRHSKDTSSADYRWGRRYLWLVAIGMGVVIAVNTAMYALAVGTFPGVVMEQDDGAEALCIANFRAVRANLSLGWQSELDYRMSKPGRLWLGANLRDDADRPLEGLLVSAKIWRPTHEGFDREVTLWETETGEYDGEVALPLDGQWDVWLTARRGTDSYERKWRIHVQ